MSEKPKITAPDEVWLNVGEITWNDKPCFAHDIRYVRCDPGERPHDELNKIHRELSVLSGCATDGRNWRKMLELIRDRIDSRGDALDYATGALRRAEAQREEAHRIVMSLVAGYVDPSQLENYRDKYAPLPADEC